MNKKNKGLIMLKSKTKTRIWGLLLCLLLVLGSGCASRHKQATPMPDIEPPKTQDVSERENKGSLFQPAKAGYLFSDNRASRVGDIVQVRVMESASASSEAETTADKESSVNVGVDNFLGQDQLLDALGALGASPAIGAQSTTEFDNDASTSRSTDVTATVAARVVKVMPNGLMQIEGKSETQVNDETQIIRVSGLVRSRDIGPNNSISSTSIADADIQYFGRGVLADKQSPGWMTRIIDNVWPF